MDQKREPMNKNRMMRPTAAGERAENREAHIHKPAGGKSGGCALKAVELTSGDLWRVAESRLRVKGFTLTAPQKSAAGIVVTRVMKAQTEGSGE